MDKAYQRFSDRKNQRQKAFGSFVLLFICFLVIGIFTNIYAQWLYQPLVLIEGIVMGGLLMYLMTRPWAIEKYETKIYVYAHQASELLELVSESDENTLAYFHKAAKKLERAILVIATIKDTLKQSNSILANALIEPLETLENRLTERILPRISKEKDIKTMMKTKSTMIAVLNHLAEIFSCENPLSIEDIISENTTLEQYDVIKVEKKPSVTKTMWSRESTKFLFSIVFGMIIVFGIAFGHSFLYKYNLVDSLSNLTSFLTLIGVAIAIGIGIYEIIKRK